MPVAVVGLTVIKPVAAFTITPAGAPVRLNEGAGLPDAVT